MSNVIKRDDPDHPMSNVLKRDDPDHPMSFVLKDDTDHHIPVVIYMYIYKKHSHKVRSSSNMLCQGDHRVFITASCLQQKTHARMTCSHITH